MNENGSLTIRNTDHCEQWRMTRPVWHLISDRRGNPIPRNRNWSGVGKPKQARLTFELNPGGRTAWSSTVCIEGQLHHVPARYWYDGQYINNAKEDAAEVALQRLHVIASPTSPSHASVCTAGNIYRPN